MDDKIGVIQRQPSNMNWLIPTNFRMVINRFDEVPYFVQEWNVPSISLPVANQANPFNNIPIPGDKLIFSDLNVTFLVGEDLKNWKEIQEWMYGLGFPESYSQYYNLVKTEADNMNAHSDISMVILDNENRPNMVMRFIDAFPSDLSGWTFDTKATSATPATATVTFKYNRFEFENV